MSSNNVVFLFPQITPNEIVIADIKNAFYEKKKDVCDEAAALTLNIVISCLEEGGYYFGEIDKTGLEKDLTLVVEAIKSMLYKYSDMEHPLQKVAEEIYVVQSPGVVAYKAKPPEEKDGVS